MSYDVSKNLISSHGFKLHKQNYISTKVFGFWIYLMSDCIIFCCLFIVYIVLMHATAGGQSGKDFFKLPIVLVENFLLLFSSATCGIANLSFLENKKNLVIFWLVVTWIIGLIFIGIEAHEINYLITHGLTPNRSAFLSAFFAVIGIHALHLNFGLIWMIVIILQNILYGLTNTNRIRVICLTLFWHFLEIIWICIFSIVYLIGIL